MNVRIFQDGELETTLANQEFMVANSHAEQLKCCSMSALGLDRERRPLYASLRIPLLRLSQRVLQNPNWP
jgi:hypothetical protein